MMMMLDVLFDQTSLKYFFVLLMRVICFLTSFDCEYAGRTFDLVVCLFVHIPDLNDTSGVVVPGGESDRDVQPRGSHLGAVYILLAALPHKQENILLPLKLRLAFHPVRTWRPKNCRDLELVLKLYLSKYLLDVVGKTFG